MLRFLRAFHFPAIDRLWKFLLATAIYTSAVCGYHEWHDIVTDRPQPSRIVEIVLSSLIFGWFMHFRANTAYDRWWEARKLWGQLVNVSRNIALKSRHLIGASETDRERLAGLLTTFADCLRKRLARPRSLPGDMEAAREPMAIAGQLYGLMGEWAANKADPWKLLALDTDARQLMDVSGACERIRSTPLASSYRGLLRTLIGVYLLGLPWMLYDEMGLWTILMTVVVSYVIIGLELIADDIENPFTPGPDALRLDNVADVIRETAAAYASRPEVL
ncbi:bestrophin family protein [Zavarzinella formosa]|uniref:bestrophin family ion channel n=1 Tax=Zavarzinella formosa TaxID=360055 RepID=UPI0002FEA62A|nr:bestrophin family ion channel [Zavarzinella formosa]